MHPAARTAISRGGPSAPLKALWAKGLVKSPVLDFGSGRGEDAKWLRGKGLQVTAYDPHHGPKTFPKRKFATVLATYVHNVLPPDEQKKITREIRGLVRAGGSAYATVRRDTCPAPRKGVQECVTLPGPEVLTGSGFVTHNLARGGQRAKTIGSRSWVHRSNVGELPQEAQRKLRGLTSDHNLVRFDQRDGSLMLGWAPGLGRSPSPALEKSVLLRDGKAPQERRYQGDSRPIYHRTELMFAPGDARRKPLEAHTRKMERRGLLSRPDIGTVGAFRRAQANRSLRTQASQLRKKAESIWKQIGPQARHPDYRTKSRVAAGRCYQTALWLRDKFPGQSVKLIQGSEGKCKKHYWVQVDGVPVDITGDQYGHPKVQVGTLPYDGKARSWPKSRAPSGHTGAMMRAQANIDEFVSTFGAPLQGGETWGDRIRKARRTQKEYAKRAWAKNEVLLGDGSVIPLNRAHPAVLYVTLEDLFGADAEAARDYVRLKHSKGRLTDIQVAALKRMGAPYWSPRGRANTSPVALAPVAPLVGTHLAMFLALRWLANQP